MANIPEERVDIGPAVVLSLSVALVAILLGLFWANALELGPIDDAYISLRYADNWATGQGLSFNPGERVEGYTNFLMVALEAIAIKMGLDPETGMFLLGWFFFGFLVFVETLAVALLLFPGRSEWTALAGLAIAVHPMLICWGASGMETCLYAALVMAAFLVLVAGTSSDRARMAGVLLALAGMTRPEALALVPVAVLVAYLRHRRRGEALQVLAWFLGIYGAYFGVRWWHFGYLFPNTFYAKLDFGGQEFWQRGALYVWDFLRASPFVTLLAVVAMGKAWRAPLWVKAWSLVVMAQVLIVVYEGGDHFAMFRFLVLAVPFLGMLALQLPVEFIRRRGWSSSVKATALSVCLALLFVSGLRMGRQQKRYEPPGVRQFARFKLESQMARDWAVMGRWLHGNAPNEASLSTIAIGAIGFFSDLTILDPYGLTDPEIAHKESDLGSGYAGHEKFDIESIFLQRPTYLLLANQLTAAPIPEEDLPRWSWGAFNKAMVADPRLRQSYRYEPVEIGTHQWMNLHLLREE